MFVDDDGCRARWLSFNDQIVEVTVHEHSRKLAWTTAGQQSAPGQVCGGCVSVELIPEGAGTRVRILASREASGRLGALARRAAAQREFERDIQRSLSQLAGLLGGRSSC